MSCFCFFNRAIITWIPKWVPVWVTKLKFSAMQAFAQYRKRYRAILLSVFQLYYSPCSRGNSVAVAVMNVTPDDLISDLNTFGLLFESYCIRDLRVYAEKLNGKVFNYRDSTGLEADAIIHLNSGQWGAIEIRLGGNDYIDAGAKHLLELQERVDTDKMKKPSFLMVMTATQFAYKRSDGVYVVPIACLKD